MAIVYGILAVLMIFSGFMCHTKWACSTICPEEEDAARGMIASQPDGQTLRSHPDSVGSTD